MDAAALELTLPHASLAEVFTTMCDDHGLSRESAVLYAASAIIRLTEVGYGHLDIPVDYTPIVAR